MFYLLYISTNQTRDSHRCWNPLKVLWGSFSWCQFHFTSVHVQVRACFPQRRASSRTARWTRRPWSTSSRPSKRTQTWATRMLPSWLPLRYIISWKYMNCNLTSVRYEEVLSLHYVFHHIVLKLYLQNWTASSLWNTPFEFPLIFRWWTADRRLGSGTGSTQQGIWLGAGKSNLPSRWTTNLKR